MTTWWAEQRSRLAGVDPGRTRLHLASVATASMITAALLASGLRAVTGQPVTIVMFAVVLAMVSNLAVNENDLARRRVTAESAASGARPPAFRSSGSGTLGSGAPGSGDAADPWPGAGADERGRVALLGAARMLRRIDQLTVGLARELCGKPAAGERAGVSGRGTPAGAG